VFYIFYIAPATTHEIIFFQLITNTANFEVAVCPLLPVSKG